ncbi:AMP-binding enzyme [Streptomyces sp. NPDC054796]
MNLDAIQQIFLSHEHVREAAVVTVPHPALGQALGALLVLAPGGTTVEEVREYARPFLPEALHPRTVLNVTELPTTHDGRFSAAGARALLRDAAHLKHPEEHREEEYRRSASSMPEAWEQVLQLARDDEVLHFEALRALADNPTLLAKITTALWYPHWPRPLTSLPDCLADLATADPDVQNYLDFASTASRDILRIIDRYGWPRANRDGPHVPDAACRVLMRADGLNEEREQALAAVTQAVANGYSNPRHLALLQDRTLTLTEREQLYGTFMLSPAGDQPHFLYETQGIDQVNVQRAIIGMPSLALDLPYAWEPLLPYGRARWAAAPPSREAPAVPAPPTRRLSSPSVPVGMAPVYLTGERRHQAALREATEHLPPPLHGTARWLALDPFTSPLAQFDAGEPAARLAALIRLEDIRRSRLLIAVASEDEQRDTVTSAEIGAALAADIPVVIVGRPEHALDEHPAISFAPDLEAALTAAQTWATR